MDTYKTQAKLFKVLMHSTRLAVLDVLRDGEQCVCHMEAVLGVRQANISQHLMVLREAGLVTDRRDGWNIYYRVSKPEIFTVIEAMNNFSGAASGEPGRRAKSSATTSAKKHTCPCPKCNPGSSAACSGPTDLALDRAETAA